jgi:hypothetical protein
MNGLDMLRAVAADLDVPDIRVDIPVGYRVTDTTDAEDMCGCLRVMRGGEPYLHRRDITHGCPPPRREHRWAINEDPAAPSVHETSDGKPDHCLVCGIVRYPLHPRARAVAEGPCMGPARRRVVSA